VSNQNRFYPNTFDVPIGAIALPDSIRLQLASVESGFYRVQQELDALGTGKGLLSLPNFPPTFYGSAYKMLRVAPSETAVEFVPAGTLPIKSIAGDSYTLVAEDAGRLLVFTSSNAVTVTVPTNATAKFNAGEPLWLMQKGAGRVTLSAAGGVKLWSSDNLLATRGQGALNAITYLGVDEWLVIGDRNAGTSLGYASLTAPNTFTKAVSVTPVQLTDAATINTDASLGNSFYVTLTAAGRTMANPTNLVSGTRYRWYIKQDATGGRTITSYGGSFAFVGGVPSLTATANAVDLIDGEYNAALGKIFCTVSKNFA